MVTIVSLDELCKELIRTHRHSGFTAQAVAFALAGDNRADGVNEKVSALKASK